IAATFLRANGRYRGLQMRRITLALVAAGALALIGGAGATDDGVWLYPVSHGTATIAAWKAQQGEQDDQGSAGQALLLEKDAFAGDNSAAAHVIGLEGLPVQVLGLAFEYRAKDGPARSRIRAGRCSSRAAAAGNTRSASVARPLRPHREPKAAGSAARSPRHSS